jgi:uncharacterized protein (DUF885 family)
MQRTAEIFVGVLLAAGLVMSAGAQAKSPEDKRFEAVADKFVEQLLKRNPETATALGDHRYDKKSSDFSAKGVAGDRALYHKTLDELAAIRAERLSADDQVDRSILQNELQTRLFDIEVMNAPALNPLVYAPTEGVYLLIARDFAPLKQRLAAVKARLEDFPKILDAAKQNLTSPPRVFTETAIQRNKGAIGLVRDELEEILKTEPAMRAKLAPARDKALAALTAYGEWLEHDLLPRSTGDFRIGKEHYREKLRLALDSELSPEDILKNAEAELKATQAAMLQTGLPLYRRYFPDKSVEGAEPKVVIRAVLDKIAESHPDNATIVDDAKKTLASATAFVREHQLVSVPDDPVQVIVMPEFQRGAAVAFCNPAGALDKKGATFFAISPTPADWSAQRVASFSVNITTPCSTILRCTRRCPGTTCN